MRSVMFKLPHEDASETTESAPQRVPVEGFRRDLRRALRLYAPLAIGAAVLAGILMVLYAVSRGTTYSASALVYIRPEGSDAATDAVDKTSTATSFDSFVQQQIQTVTREDTLSDALTQTMTNAGSGSEDGLWIAPGEPLKTAAGRLAKSLRVERKAGSYQLSIGLTGRDPHAVANVVNAVVASYIAHERRDRLNHNESQIAALRKQRVEVLDELNSTTFLQAQLSKSVGIASRAASGHTDESKHVARRGSRRSARPAQRSRASRRDARLVRKKQAPRHTTRRTQPNSVPQYDTQLAQMRTQLAEARASRAIAEAQYASAQGGQASLDAAAAETYATDPGLIALKENLNQRRSVLFAQMAALTPKDSAYKRSQEELSRLDQQFDSMSRQMREEDTQQVLDRLRLEAERREDIEAGLSAQLQGLADTASPGARTHDPAAPVAADTTRLRARFTEVDNAIHALELQRNSNGVAHALVAADPAPHPDKTGKWILLGAAVPIALLFGIAAAYVRYHLDPHVYVAEDVSQYLGFPPIVTLPNASEVDARTFDEFMLRLAAGISQAHTSGGARSFVFSAVSVATSITPLVDELGRRMQLLGYRTLVKKASAAFGNAAPATEREPSRTFERRLSTLAEPASTELQRRSLLDESLDPLAHASDIFLIEAPPFASSAEAEFAARFADMTILVPESAVTTRTELSNTLAITRRINVAGIAAILLNLRLRNADPEFSASVGTTGRRGEPNKPKAKREPRGADVYPVRFVEPGKVPPTKR